MPTKLDRDAIWHRTYKRCHLPDRYGISVLTAISAYEHSAQAFGELNASIGAEGADIKLSLILTPIEMRDLARILNEQAAVLETIESEAAEMNAAIEQEKVDEARATSLAAAA